MMVKRRLLWLGSLALVVTLVMEIAWTDLEHAYFWWHAFPGLDMAFGFIGCLSIIYVSKWLGKYFLKRDENYYGDER